MAAPPNSIAGFELEAAKPIDPFTLAADQDQDESVPVSRFLPAFGLDLLPERMRPEETGRIGLHAAIDDRDGDRVFALHHVFRDIENAWVGQSPLAFDSLPLTYKVKLLSAVTNAIAREGTFSRA